MIGIAVIACIGLNFGAIANGDSQPEWFTVFGTTFYFIVAIMLSIALGNLFVTIKRMFDNLLKMEISGLLKFMSFFTFSFVIRAFAIVLVSPFHICLLHSTSV